MPELKTRPGISQATLQRLGVRHVDEAEAVKLIGQRYAGLYIPYGIHVEGKPFGRLRLDTPADGRKYTQRAGTGVHPYIPAFPDLWTQGDLVIVEGEFKAIALCEAGFRAIGIAGFYGFMNEGRLCVRLEKHFKEHPAQRVLFLGDNDTALNYQFSDAAVKLVALAGSVPVLLPRIPLSMPKGADDCREALGEKFPAWWASLVASTVPVPPKLKPDMLAVELFKTAIPDLKTTTGIERSMMLQRLGKLVACLHPMARGEIADICKAELAINKSTLQQAAAAASREKEQTRTAKEEWKATMELYGNPAFYSRDGKNLTGLNERFWPGSSGSSTCCCMNPTRSGFIVTTNPPACGGCNPTRCLNSLPVTR